VAVSIRELIGGMSRANKLWGAPRIHGELLKLGIEVPSTVGKYLRRTRKPPSQTWRTFLKNHMAQMASMDFFTVPTATLRVLFVFLVLSVTHTALEHNGTPDGGVDRATASRSFRSAATGHRKLLISLLYAVLSTDSEIRALLVALLHRSEYHGITHALWGGWETVCRRGVAVGSVCVWAAMTRERGSS